MRRKPTILDAHACRIHGTLKAAGRAMSATEIGDQLGISRTTVRNIAVSRGWLLSDGRMRVLSRINRALDARHAGAPEELDFDRPGALSNVVMTEMADA